LKKLKGKIINHNHSFNGEINFDKKIVKINKIKNNDFDYYIIPGFVDLHCHGGYGHDTMEGIPSIDKMSQYHLKNGTTTLLATTLTASLKDTLTALKGFKSFIKKNRYITNLIGAHLEGPFINPKKLGAQPSMTQKPNKKFIDKIQKEAEIKIVTLAPELKGSKKLIDYLIKKKIKVQFGHSLANYDCCFKIMQKHNIGFTHLYNAMSGNHHREPGVLSAALHLAKFSEIICDLYHVSKPNILLAHKCIPYLYAVSDSISASGMPDGKYNFANLKITKKKNQAWIKNDILAGSIVNMHDSFKNLLKVNLSLENIVAMTSYNAAKYLNQTKIGKIEKGYFSNFLVLDKKFNIKKVYLYGNLI
tara:strand:+ start:13 stop:1095 length:1083 start_codon:yes stop_codon:yes gene_type:complete